MHTHFHKGTPIIIGFKDGRKIEGKFFDHKSGMVILEDGKKIKLSEVRFMTARKLKNKNGDKNGGCPHMGATPIVPISQAIEILSSGGVGVLPTDTIYGLVGSAFSKDAVKRIYRLRKRDLAKPMIILIGDKEDLKLFDIKINVKERRILSRFWPGKISVILPCLSEIFYYLHRGTKSLAIRLPQNQELISILKETGPLVAPSANLQNMSPAQTIEEAWKYFSNKIDFYVDGGKLESEPSTLITLKDGEIIVKRKGAVAIS